MDRQIIYPGAIPLETDLLNTNKNAMIGLSKLAAAILGTSTFMNGLACTPTGPASLQVYVAPGEIYSLQNMDGTAYSSIAADTTHAILKQGIMLDQATLSCPAPVTAGQSINYLIQVAYQDTDSGAVVLPYYNASNPAQAYSGPNNSGTAQNTVRKGVCAVSAKAGVAATTGTQTTPAPDAGYVGAFVVTVANGQTQITAPNISTYAGAPFLPTGGLVVGGLQNNLCNSSVAGGTADALTGSYFPGITALPAAGAGVLTLYLRASSANATTTPTFTPNSGVIAAKQIVKGNGLALAAGDIAGGGHWIELQYDATLDKWVLLNPATGVSPVGLRASALTTVSTSATLTAANLGQTILLNSGSAIAPVLPLASACPAGTRIEFFNTNAGIATLTRQGTDNIVLNSANLTTVAVGLGDTLTLESNGSNAWYGVGGSAQLGAAAKFGSSIGTNGYQKLPSGLIVQWGQVATSSGGDTAVTFPVAFPTQGNALVGSVFNNTTNGTWFPAFYNFTTTGFSVSAYLSTTGARQVQSVSWVAFGY